MKMIKNLLLIIFILLMFSCSNKGNNNATNESEINLVDYTILKEIIYDKPIKTQVHLDVLLRSENISEYEVRTLLNFLYEKTKYRKGFEYHDNPTNIYIYVYGSKEKAKAEMGQWIGMVAKGYDEEFPEIRISEKQLKSLTILPEEKFGLSNKQRIDIWNKLIKAEDRAEIEAEKRYPIDNANLTREDIKNNSKYFNSLLKQYEKEIAKEFNIELAIEDSITIEGIKKGWSFPR
jgi:hypothetical protein